MFRFKSVVTKLGIPCLVSILAFATAHHTFESKAQYSTQKGSRTIGILRMHMRRGALVAREINQLVSRSLEYKACRLA
jgi:hypothetical protein